ncbi:MAG: flavin reductase family protein [Candidatus Omnitrophica bacterium]|nr:flavin reductase family protein [Candidatus Omnitrophota bacterium]
MRKLEVPASEALYPVPVVLVSALDREALRANIITIAWCGVVASKPPLISLSIRPSRHSHKLIIAEREFVINIPAKESVREADLCGTLSGRDIDKFKQCGFTPIKSSKISAPLIKECPVNIECRLKDVVKLGSHDMFIGEVLVVHVDEAILGDDGKIDYAKAKPFVYNQGEYRECGSRIGHYGFSSK